jgi:hypothetical protein
MTAKKPRGTAPAKTKTTVRNQTMNTRTSAEIKSMVAELAKANRTIGGTIEWLIRTEYAEHVRRLRRGK